MNRPFVNFAGWVKNEAHVSALKVIVSACKQILITSNMCPPDPSNPPAPTELRVANMSFGPGSTVGARIEWSMPPDLDVPIHHYKVSWSWTAVGHSSTSSLTKRRKTVRKVRMPQLQMEHVKNTTSL